MVGNECKRPGEGFWYAETAKFYRWELAGDWTTEEADWVNSYKRW